MTTQGPPPAPEGTTEARRAASRDLLAAGLAEAAARWGAFDLPLERFAPRALARVARRLERLGVAPAPEALRDALAHTATADLALAVACSEGVAGAWEILVARLSPRLEGLARRRGASPEAARTAASDVLSEMSLPAAQSEPRTLLDTYDGSGSLFGWAAVILVRRLSRARPAGARGGPTTPLPLDPAAGARSDPRAPDPPEALVSAETARRLTRSLASAWGALSGRERLALSLRYLDGRPQTEIAGVLRVSEPHTSRILAAALERFRATVRAAMGPDAPEPGAGWPAFVDAVRRSRVFAAGETPLPFEDPPPSRGRP